MSDSPRRPAADSPGAEAFPFGNRRRLLLMAGFLLVLYGLSLTPHWRFQRDSAWYLGLGRSLGTGQGYTFNGKLCTFYPPGYPAIVCAVGYVFGFPGSFHDSFLALNLTQAAFALGSIFLLALIVRDLRFPPRLAWPIVLLWGVSRTLYFHAGQDMTDVPFVCLGLLALWTGLRMAREEGLRSWAWWAAASGTIVAASAVRATGPLLVPAILAELWLVPDRRQRWRGNLLKSLLMVAVLAVPLRAWMLFTRQAIGPHYAGYFRDTADLDHVMRIPRHLFSHLFEYLGNTSNAISGTALTAPVGLLVWAVLVVGMWQMIRRRQWALVAYGVLTILALLGPGFRSRRYLLPVLPLMYCWLVLGADATGRWLCRHTEFWTPRRCRRVALGALVLLVGTNLLRDGKVIMEARSPDFYEAAESGRGADYALVTDWLRENAAPDAVVFCYEATSVHYFTGLHTVRTPHSGDEASPSSLRRLFAEEGVQYVVSDTRKSASAAWLSRLQQEAPRVMTSVLALKRVELFRVNTSELSAPLSAGGTAPPDGDRAGSQTATIDGNSCPVGTWAGPAGRLRT